MTAARSRPFRFLRDPVFLLGCAGYLAARLLVRPHLAAGSPLRAHGTDFFLIPCALPVLLWLQHRLGLRDDARPGAEEIALYTALWALLFEVAFPQWWHRGVADAGDAAAYALGAAAAWAGWRWLPLTRPAGGRYLFSHSCPPLSESISSKTSSR